MLSIAELGLPNDSIDSSPVNVALQSAKGDEKLGEQQEPKIEEPIYLDIGESSFDKLRGVSTSPGHTQDEPEELIKEEFLDGEVEESALDKLSRLIDS